SLADAEALDSPARILERDLRREGNLRTRPVAPDGFPARRLVCVRHEEAALPKKRILRSRRRDERQAEDVLAHGISVGSSKTAQRDQVDRHITPNRPSGDDPAVAPGRWDVDVASLGERRAALPLCLLLLFLREDLQRG